MTMEPKDKTPTASAYLTVPASPAWYGTIRNMVINISRNSGVSDRSAGAIALAVDEAVSNIHRHGYQGDHEQPISVEINVKKSSDTEPYSVWICIEDRAKQVELTDIKSRDLSKVRPGGLGVHLINSLMDKATWSHRTNGGMRLILEKTGSKNTHDKTTEPSLPAESEQ
jgi:anti-sigma regulatory factor (Ser/Thr protein kinase)